MKLNPVKWHEEPTNAARQYWTAHHGPFTINITYQMFPASNMFPFVQHSWYIVEELEVGSWSRIYWGEEPVGTIENAKAIAEAWLLEKAKELKAKLDEMVEQP